MFGAYSQFLILSNSYTIKLANRFYHIWPSEARKCDPIKDRHTVLVHSRRQDPTHDNRWTNILFHTWWTESRTYGKITRRWPFSCRRSKLIYHTWQTEGRTCDTTLDSRRTTTWQKGEHSHDPSRDNKRMNTRSTRTWQQKN